MTWQTIALTEIIQGCREESHLRYHAAEPGRCYELFRRALTQQNEAAWTAVQQQYQRLVQTWVRQCAGWLPQAPELLDEIVQIAFVKFWRTLSQRDDFAAQFPHEGAVLRYLNRCAVSACQDFKRKQQRQVRLQQLLEARAKLRQTAVHMQPDMNEDPPELVALRRWLDNELPDPTERLLIRLTFVYELKPREIVQQYPDHFPDVQTVYRIKDRLLKRARRALLAEMSQNKERAR